MTIQHTPFDKLIINIDQGLRTLFGNNALSTRRNPAASAEYTRLSKTERKHSAGLMRINHAGEVSAQALYQGQALTARDQTVQVKMQHAAREEVDHLAWCQERLEELGSHVSYLNPLWYAGSFVIGAVAGAVGDQWSLGFVAETEHQVVDHLTRHLQSLPVHDHKSRAIVEQMRTDEGEHATMAINAGGAPLPKPIQVSMKIMSKVMTTLAYYV